MSLKSTSKKKKKLYIIVSDIFQIKKKPETLPGTFFDIYVFFKKFTILTDEDVDVAHVI